MTRLNNIHLAALILYLTFMSCTSLAQNPIPNSGFENWTNAGLFEDPDDWFTPNQVTSLAGVVTVEKTTDAYSGIYAIRLETKNVITETIPGIAMAGVLNPLSLEVDPGFAIPSNPVSLSGWYKYQPFILDVGSIEVLLTKWNPSLKLTEPIGTGIYVEPLTVSSYKSFTINIIYTSSDTADTAIITLLSGSYTNPPGSVLFVDDLSFTFPPPPSVGINNNALVSAIQVYPIPASDRIFIADQNANASRIDIMNIQGQLMRSFVLHSGINELKLDGFEEGTYLYVIADKTGAGIQKGKFVIKK